MVAVKLRRDRLRGTVYSEAGTVQLIPTSDAATMAHPPATVPQPTAAPALTGPPAALVTTAPTSAAPATTVVAPAPGSPPAVPTTRQGSRWSRRRAANSVVSGATPDPTKALPSADAPPTAATVPATGDSDRPSYHLYRPTSSEHPTDGAT